MLLRRRKWIAMLGMGLTWLVATAVADDSPRKLAQIERRIHGTWPGGPCVGQLTLNADGTFQRSHFTPGGYRLSGTWKLRWDDLPPVLELACKDSDHEPYRGTTMELELMELKETILAYRTRHEVDVVKLRRAQ